MLRCRPTAALALALCLIQGCSALFGELVEDVLSERPNGVHILYQGPAHADFERPLPQAVEATLFVNFEDYYNQAQEFNGRGPNTYLAEGQQFVVAVADGRVTGVVGSVYDASGRFFTEFSPALTDLPISEEQISTNPCRRFKRLATAVQKYGHMYYHFVQEVLPRIILLRPFLDADTKLLTFGSPYELKWLAELGISEHMIEVYDPSAQYCAEELLVPNMSPIVTPPKENYELLRTTFHADETLSEEQRDLIIYCSRRNAGDRQVTNEDDLLSAVSSQFPTAKLQVYSGTESVADTISLFRRAKVVVGMHGAGLSHSIFSAPGTAVIEFLFMNDPPMMFWHASAALAQRYIMVPLAQTWWLDQSVHVPTQDVIDALAMALGVKEGACKPGFALSLSTGDCTACPVGTYRPLGAAACVSCASGRAAVAEGSAFCTTCPSASFSVDGGGSCEACPVDMVTMFPGSPSAASCRPALEVNLDLDGMFGKDLLTKKLVSLPAFNLELPKSASGWLSLAASPTNMYRLYRQRQLRFRYLDQLFVTDDQRLNLEGGYMEDDMEELEGDEEEQGGAVSDRRILQSYRRSLYSRRSLAAGDENSLSRSSLYGRRSLYSRRSLIAGDDSGFSRSSLYRRRSLYTRRSLQADDVSGFSRGSPYRRRSLYSRRSLMVGDDNGLTRSLYGRRSLQSGLTRSLYSRRSLQAEDDSGFSRTAVYGRRSLQQYRRRLATYSRRLSSAARSLQQYGRKLLSRSLSQYSRRVLQSYRRTLAQYGGRRLQSDKGWTVGRALQAARQKLGL